MNGQHQRFIVDRLGDVVVGSKPHRLHCSLNGPKRCDHDDGGLNFLFRNAAQQLNAIQVRHAQVCDDEFRLRLAKDAKRFASGGGKLHAVPGLGELHLDDPAYAAVVIYNQDGISGHV